MSRETWETLLQDSDEDAGRSYRRRRSRTPQTAPVTGRQLATETAGSERAAYQLRGSLGSGGMAQVLLARQDSLGRDVAIKVMRAERVESDRQRFRQESILTARLEHPYIVPAHDAGDDFLVLKRVRGHTLRQAIGDSPVQGETLAELVEVLAKVSDAIAFAHDAGVVHRDIKPDNIMIGAHGEVQVMDWGLACELEADGLVPDDAGLAGTPCYCAPEMAADGGRIGPAADVFLLGATLYRLLTGRPPFDASSAHQALRRARANERDAVAGINPEAPDELIALVELAMHSDPGQRPDAVGFGAGLRSWLRGQADQRELAEWSAQAEQLQAEAATVPSDEGYARLAQAQALWQRVYSRQPSEHVRERRRSVQEAAIRSALGSGDLGLARSLLEAPEADDVDPVLAADWQAAVDKRRRLERVRRLLQVSVLLVLLALVFGLLVWVDYQRRSDERAEAGRRNEAQTLLDEAEALAITGAGAERWRWHEERLVLAQRAAGLYPQIPDLQRRIASWSAAYAEDALAAGAVDIARQQRSVLEASGYHDDVVTAIDAALNRRSEQLRERRRLFDRHIETLRYPRLDGLIDDPVRTVASWSGPEIGEWLAAVASDEIVLVRVFVARVLGLRPDLDPTPLLLLMRDQEPYVAEVAFSMLAQRSDPGVLAHLLDYVLADSDELESRVRALALWDRLVEPGAIESLVSGGHAAGFRRAAMAALLVEDHDRSWSIWGQIPAGVRTAVDERRMLESALALGLQVDAVRESLHFVASDPGVRLGLARVQLAAGQPRQAAALLAEVVPDLPASDPAWKEALLPLEVWRMYAHLQSGAAVDENALERLYGLRRRFRAWRWGPCFGIAAQLFAAAGQGERADAWRQDGAHVWGQADQHRQRLRRRGHQVQERRVVQYLLRAAPGRVGLADRLAEIDAVLQGTATSP